MNISFDLNKTFEDKEEVREFLQKCSDVNTKFIYSYETPVKKTLNPPIPFNTLKLQQASSQEFSYSSKETMQICQTLYEEGYITYMRTETTKYSAEFIDSVKIYIYGITPTQENNKYINENIDLLANNTETNHEAIRPTNINLLVADLKMGLKERKMYGLIWKNTLESCMASSTYYALYSTITLSDNYYFSCISTKLDFLGWKMVANKKPEDSKEFQYLQSIEKGVEIKYNKISSTIGITDYSSHLTESKLIKKMQEHSIGRPSTVANLIDKIQEKKYVKKGNIMGEKRLCLEFELEYNGRIVEINREKVFGNEKNVFIIQPLGIQVCDVLYSRFDDLFNYEYTKNMEANLDNVSDGSLVWYKLCEMYYNQLNNLLLEQGEKKDVEKKKGEKKEGEKKEGEKKEEGDKKTIIREIDEYTSIRIGKSGNDYIYYKTPKMKKPKFYNVQQFKKDYLEDYYTCDVKLIKEWIKNQ